jgi:hypothetical protein
MTPEERIAALEKTVRGFDLRTAGINVQGGFQELKPKATLEERLTHLETLHDQFTIRGSHGVKVEGSMRTGFAVNMSCPEGVAPSGGVIPVTPPPPPVPTVFDVEICATLTTSCGTSSGCYTFSPSTTFSHMIDLSPFGGCIITGGGLNFSTPNWILSFNYGECNFQEVNHGSGICHQDCMCQDASFNFYSTNLGLDPTGTYGISLDDAGPDCTPEYVPTPVHYDLVVTITPH